MKKIFTLCFILLLFNAKSYCQTQFPFYGFELSNYEVGDTLEYSYMDAGGLPFVQGSSNTVYVILNKKLFANDSVQYTIREVTTGTNQSNGPSYYYSTGDTIQPVIINDTVFNNHNNLLNVPLSRLDTVNFYHFCDDGCGIDSAYVKFDTVNGSKKLRLEYDAQDKIHYITFSFLATENIGLIWYSNYSLNGYLQYNLIYARLAHYGVYGTYKDLFDNVNKVTPNSLSTSVFYNIEGEAVLNISSMQTNVSFTLTVTDLLGREIKTMPVNIGNNLISLNTFTRGLYLYKVTSNGIVLGQGKLMNLFNYQP